MLLSTQTDYIGSRLGDEKAIRLLADAGFDAIDYSMFGMENKEYYLRDENAFSYVEHLREVAQDCGVVFNQAHAPFSFRGWDDEECVKSEIFPTIVRAVSLAGRMGVKIIVVHPAQHLPYPENAERLFEINMKLYRALIPYCEEYGIKVATENMWKRDKKRGYILDSVCSQAKEFNRYLDELNSPWIVGCLDLGHCGLVGVEAQDMIREMGAKHIQALHVHDNDYISDAHTEPFSGKMNWKEITKALGEIGYTGDLTFEADNCFRNNIDDEALPIRAKYLHDLGRYLIKNIEAARK